MGLVISLYFAALNPQISAAKVEEYTLLIPKLLSIFKVAGRVDNAQDHPTIVCLRNI